MTYTEVYENVIVAVDRTKNAVVLECPPTLGNWLDKCSNSLSDWLTQPELDKAGLSVPGVYRCLVNVVIDHDRGYFAYLGESSNPDVHLTVSNAGRLQLPTP